MSASSRRVLVTGGASGLGAALVERCAARGDRVLSCDLTDVSDPDAAPAPSTSDTSAEGGGGEVVHRVLDVRSDEDWAAARAWVEREWGGLDLLVNNAGVAGGGRIELTSLDDWQWILEINLLGVVRGVRTFTPLFKAQESGWIVNTASLAGLVHPPGMGSYNASKAAVVAFSETVSHELAPYGVGCTAVCPSYFRTNLMRSMRGEDTDLAASMATLVADSPITAGEIADAVLEGVERGDPLVLPDQPARDAHAWKLADRPGYDRFMAGTAARIRERTGG